MSSALTVRVTGGAQLRVALFAAPLGKPVTRSRTGDIRRRVHAGNYTLVGRDGDVSCSAPLRVPPAAAVAATVHPAGHDPCFIRVEYLSFGDLIGKDLKLARAAASRRGFLLRVVRRKGRSVPHTLDLRFDRVNVDVERGEVRGVDGVY